MRTISRDPNCTNHYDDGSKIFPNRECCKPLVISDLAERIASNESRLSQCDPAFDGYERGHFVQMAIDEVIQQKDVKIEALRLALQASTQMLRRLRDRVADILKLYLN